MNLYKLRQNLEKNEFVQNRRACEILPPSNLYKFQNDEFVQINHGISTEREISGISHFQFFFKSEFVQTKQTNSLFLRGIKKR